MPCLRFVSESEKNGKQIERKGQTERNGSNGKTKARKDQIMISRQHSRMDSVRN